MDESNADSPRTQLIMKRGSRDSVETDTVPGQWKMEKVNTTNGFVLRVHVVGDRRRPAIITFHDLGLTANSCFQRFFEYSEMSVIGEKYCVYHVTAPGQGEDADPLPENTPYPSMDELAEMIGTVVSHFKLKTFVGFGVGAGANILCRYALKYPKVIDGLILVDCSAGTSGWMEWGYQKAAVFTMRSKGMGGMAIDYLMWHHFGRNLDDCSADVVQSFRNYFSAIENTKNLAAFVESYAKRTDLGLRRDGLTLSQPVLLIAGAGSAHLSEGVEMNSKLNPIRANWMKISECSGMVLEEKPDKVAEAILLFLQGLGHFPTMSHLKWRQSRSGSICSLRSNSICVPDLNMSSAQHGGLMVRQSPIRESVSEENVCDH